MERFIYLMLPSIFFVRFYLKEKYNSLDYITTYLKLCFITNFICIIFVLKYYTHIVLTSTLSFVIKYSLLALFVNVLLVVAYKVITNYIQVKFDVKRISKKNEKN